MKNLGKHKLAFIGDDFTGSIDTMETLSARGVSTVLFVTPPNAEMLRRFGNPQAIGVATNMRSMNPEQIDAYFPKIVDDLQSFGASFLHYKVCSTFDSSPSSGSIGRVLDSHRALAGSARRYVLLGQPNLSRYGVFGTLFAQLGADGPIYRIDRHPSMARHPITPMNEADIVRHIGAQTTQPIRLLNYLELRELARDDTAIDLLHADQENEVFLIDIADEGAIADVGRILWRNASAEKPVFVVGASTVEQALVQTDDCPVELASTGRELEETPDAAQRLLVISGSCSPVTAQQIRRAVADGFVEIALDPIDLLTSPDGILSDRLAGQVGASLDQGRAVIAHTCLGPDDPRRNAAAQLFKVDAKDPDTAARMAGLSIAKVVQRLLLTLLREHELSRLCLAGGDFSSMIVQGIGIDALTIKKRIGPGVSLCTAHSQDIPLDQLEIALKGGQMGRATYFSDLRALSAH